MARVRSTGLYRSTFNFGATTFDLTDTGGERSERKKWIKFREGDEVPDLVLFAVDISAYDLVLYEDHTSNRMQEDLALFETMINSKWLAKTRFILIFTKMDIFERKILKNPIKDYFPDFAGDETSPDDTKYYIGNRFLSLNRDEANEIKTMYTSFSGGYNESTRLVLNVITSQLSLGPRGDTV